MTNVGRVLVVDDDRELGLALKRALDGEGFSTVAVCSPEEALERFASDEFDVLLTDLVMEGTTGTELCSRALEMRPDVPVVLITAHGTLETAVEAMRAGAYDFVTKPVELETLCAAMARAVQKRRLHPEPRRVLRLDDDEIEPGALIGSSAQIRRVRELVGRIAPSDAAVLLEGETGTGKEVVARALHDASGRKGSFIAVNCAAVPRNLIESELFGHVRGAFTDARERRAGLFVDAHGGTIFLDEIGDLPLDVQPKLLRALQEHRVRPIGSSLEVPFDARVCAATHRDLEREVTEGRFRQDLYYRINVMRIDLPPLRARGTDVVDLALHFLARAHERGGPRFGLTAAAAEALVAYAWPGNVRELQNCIERAMVLARHGEITVADLPEKVRAARAKPNASGESVDIVPLAEIERRHIVGVLTAFGGNKVRAAHALGVNRKTLYRKLARYGVRRSSKRSGSD